MAENLPGANVQPPYIHIVITPIEGLKFTSNLGQAQINLLIDQVKMGVVSGQLRPANLPGAGIVMPNGNVR